MATEPPSQPSFSKKQYFIGLGIGSIPLLVYVLAFALGNVSGGYGAIYALLGAIALYVILIITSIVLAIIRQTRYLGYGLLTMVFVSPVVGYIACTVVNSMPSV